MPTVDREGASIAYRFDGPPVAPVLLLSNSLGTTTSMWDDVIVVLAQRFLVVRYDHRGHGDSSATPGPYSIETLGLDALAVLDTLDVATASICGASMGGAVGLWIASHVPGRVERLVLCCSAPSFGAPEIWTDRAALVRAEGPGTLLDALMERWFTPELTDRSSARARVSSMLETVDPEGYASCCEALAGLDLTEELGAIGAPTLVLAGALDPVCPPEASVAMATKITGSSLAVLPDVAHQAAMEQPAQVADAVVTHLIGAATVRGERIRRRVLGDQYVDQARRNASPWTAPFQDLATRFAWGEIWTRPGLDLGTRSCITVAMCIALGRLDELELHLRGAERNGVSRDELTEVLLQSTVYCGVPAGNSAFAVARRVFGEAEEGG